MSVLTKGNDNYLFSFLIASTHPRSLLNNQSTTKMTKQNKGNDQ